MATLYRRLCVAAILAVLSLITLISLLPRSHMDRLQTITLGGKIDMNGIWRWVDGGEVEEEGEGGVSLVVLGDGWVGDTAEKGEDAKGRGNSWVAILCEEINCTSYLNLASSITTSLAHFSVAASPTGAATSNKIHISSQAADQSSPFTANETIPLLPDLAAQIQSFISAPLPKTIPSKTIFVLSFGFWDIYSFVSLDVAGAQSATEHSIDEIFAQLDILYAYFAQTLYPPTPIFSSESKKVEVNTETESSITTTKLPHPNFQIIIPRLFDPTMMPGWLSERPVPLKPSSVAEQQKNAVYLTERWNSLMENRLGAWLETKLPIYTPSLPSKEHVKAKVADKGKGASRTDIRHPVPSDFSSRAGNTARSSKEGNYPRKEIFYFDLPSYLLSLIVDHNLQREGITDASGLGTQKSPYVSVYEPCIQEGRVGKGEMEEEELEGFEERGGLLVCKEPEKFLFWDAWSLGSRAKKEVGRSVGMLVQEGRGLRRKEKD